MRKAQITLFIIIGLLILLFIGVLLYFTSRQAIAPIRKAIQVPQDVKPVSDAVTTCIDQLGKEGLTILGNQGGYITIPKVVEHNPTSYILVDPAGIVKTPFWYYEGEDRTPTPEFMQRELEVYIKQNLQDCLANFQGFLPTFKIAPQGPAIPQVSLTDNSVVIQLTWPLDITSTDKTTRIQDFATEEDVPLKRIWELADKTMKTENRDGWFENLTIDFISTNPRTPLNGFEFSCAPHKWFIPDVKTELQNTLYYNLPFVRIQNTNYPPAQESDATYDKLRTSAQRIRTDLEAGNEPTFPTNAPDDAFEMNRMRIDVGTQKNPLKAAFIFERNWPLYLNARPNRGGVLSPANMKGPRKYLSFLCINQWHFAYDIIYPIKLAIRDDNSYGGQGYLFQMAFPVIIKDNEESRVFFGIRKFVPPDITTDFCTTFGDKAIDIRATGFTPGSPIAEELDNANITYRCLNQECKLGTTYSDGSGAIRLYTYLPQGCGPPQISAAKEGYLTGKQFATEDKITIPLTRLKHMNYSLIIRPYSEEVSQTNPEDARAQRWLDGQSYTSLPQTIHATISISARNASLDQYLTYPANTTQFFAEQYNYSVGDTTQFAPNTVDFIWEDATYDLDIILFKTDQPIGGYHIQNLTVPYDTVAANNNVIFNVVEYRPLPVKGYQQAGMFTFLYDRGTYDNQPYAQALKPTFTP